MAKLIALGLQTGITNPKFVLIRRTDGYYWSTATNSFETYNAANIANYGITAAEDGASGIYKADNPSDTTIATYYFIQAAGGSLVVNDLLNNVYYDDVFEPETTVTSVGLSAATCNQIADHVRRRSQANVEASAHGDALSLESEYGMIQQAQESVVSGSTMTVKKTDGTTTLGTKALSTSATADPITGIS